ncbi:MAG: SGNH/GDSL hydrolase family protein [Victivallales bacterium]|jgi:lysophospholipase L1-like esterase|nr:SGNH/GDSL hydrolase family protein [Victivallales bacterium]
MPSEDKLSFVENSDNPADFRKQEGDYVILFKGNSITRHGVSEKTIAELGWDHLAGMAASSESKDYAHLFADKIQAEMQDKRIRLLFGRGGRPVLSLAGVELEAHADPDLIIVQNGEHSALYPEVENFARDHEKLISSLKKSCPKARIISIGIWNPTARGNELSACASPEYDQCAKRIEEAQKEVAAKFQIDFVSVAKFGQDPANFGTGKVAGVCWHPNDNGMKCYADALSEAFF